MLIFTKLEPFGEPGEDLRAGRIASPIVNLLKKLVYKDPPDGTPDDWLPADLRPVHQQSWEEMRNMAQAFAAAHKPKK